MSVGVVGDMCMCALGISVYLVCVFCEYLFGTGVLSTDTRVCMYKKIVY